MGQISKLRSKKRIERNIVLYPVRFKKQFGRFSLPNVLLNQLAHNGFTLKPRDIVVMSSKFAAMAEGRFLKLNSIKVGNQAKSIARKYNIDNNLTQLVLRESDEILGGIPGFLLATKNGILAPNAGIDKSNVPEGYAILYPKDPDKIAQWLRRRLLQSIGNRRDQKSQELGVILSDSRIAPMRVGTIGVAISIAGFEPVEDLRGTRDLFGKELKVTIRAVADQLASSAELLMGESDEAVPVVVIRGARVAFSARPKGVMNIESEKCLVIQGLKNSVKVRRKSSGVTTVVSLKSRLKNR